MTVTSELSNSIIYKSLFDNHPDSVVLLNLQGSYVDVNSSAEILAGYTRGEFLELTISDLVADEYIEIASQNFEKVLGGEPQIHENVIIHKNGTCIHVLLTFIPIKSDNKVVGAFCIAKDITAPKAEQKRLLEIQKLNQLIVENSQDILAYCTPDGIHRYISPAVKTLLGYEPEELMGTLSTDLYHPEDVEHVLMSRKHLDSDEFSFRVRHKNGSYIWLETTINYIRNKDGEVEYILGVGRDISKRRISEKIHRNSLDELRQSEDKFKSAFDNAPIGMALLSLEGEWIKLNKALCHILGYSEEELLKLTFHGISRREDIELCVENAQILLQGLETSYTMDRCLIHRNGYFVWVKLTVSLVKDDYDKPSYFIAQIQDITERVQLGELRKQSEELLRRADTLSSIGQMVASIAHEIRNPMTSIRGFIQLLKRRSTCSKDIEYYDIMLGELDRANGIITDFLTLSKARNVEKKQHSLNDIILGIFPMISADSIMRNQNIELELDEHVHTLLLDEREIKQLILNLARNALEAMDNGGVLLLSTKQIDDETVLFQISDTGCGIPEDKLSCMFDPFFTTKEEGTGLGLPVCLSIVEKHGGTLNVHSELGKGTIFRITFNQE